MKKFLVILSVIALLIFTFFFSNIYGYYRFKQYCEKEGGLKVYQPLQRNVGWWAKDKYDAQAAAQLNGVGFVRYKDNKNGEAYDIKYVGGNPQDENSYIKNPSGYEKIVKYQWISEWNYMDENKRIKRSVYKVLSINNTSLIAIFSSFYFSPYGGKLGGPDWMICSDAGSTDLSWKLSLESIFTKQN